MAKLEPRNVSDPMDEPQREPFLNWIEVDGAPRPAATLREWADWHDDYGHRFLARTLRVGNGFVVTIFTGVTHSFDETGAPLGLYGTMAIGTAFGHGREYIHDTRAEALAYHAELCAVISLCTVVALWRMAIVGAEYEAGMS